MRIEPDIGAQWMYWMMRGDFERAWKLSDRVPGGRVRSLEQLRGKRVLLRCEHGLGDTIQFIRYAALLQPLARQILIHVQPRLRPIARALPEIDFAFTWTDPWPDGGYDCEVEIMWLPYLFRTTLDSVPRKVPYLRIDPRLVRASRAAYRREGYLNVGIQPRAGDWDPRRSVPSAALAPLRRVPGIAMFDLEPRPEDPDVTGTAAAIANLDLVITADTMAAHLAGALGKPVWVLLPHEADWRWMTRREDSPWYPTMRLFRQDGRRDWLPVIGRVLDELRLDAQGHKKAAPAA